MKKAGIITVGIVIMLFTAGAYAMGELHTSGTWRYKMTVVVETPEGIKTGSAVREVSNSASTVKILDFPEATNPPKVKGEAIIVDLGDRGVLFGLMDTNGSYDVVFKTFPGPPGNSAEGIKYYRDLKDVEAPTKVMPQFVRFRDLKDPLTVEAVDYKNFSASFGESVKLKAVTIEMVDGQVTEVIERWLPWLKTNKEGYLDGRRSGGGPSLSNILHAGNFKRGD